MVRKFLARCRECALLIGAVYSVAFSAAAASAANVPLAQPTATASQSGLSIANVLDGNQATGWGLYQGGNAPVLGQTAAFETVSDVGFAGGTKLTFVVDQQFGGNLTVGRFRLSATTDDRGDFADGAINVGDVTANWTVLDAVSAVAASGATLTEQGDNSILASGIDPASDAYTVVALTNLLGITGFRLEMIEDSSLPLDGPGRNFSGNLVVTEFSVDAAVVPEPSTLALSAMGLVGLVAYRVRSRRRTS